MVRKVRFTTHKCASLTAETRNLLFFDPAVSVSEKIQAKSRSWDNVLPGNVQQPMAELSQLLDIDSDPHQVYWVMVKAAFEGLAVLLATLWY